MRALQRIINYSDPKNTEISRNAWAYEDFCKHVQEDELPVWWLLSQEVSDILDGVAALLKGVRE